MAGYTKLFGSILQSTVWQSPMHVKVVWITLLALSDQDGEISASVPGLAAAAGVSIGECEQALGAFLAPDPYSRTPEHEGRRLEKCDGGWRLLNHAKYRAMQTQEEARARTAARVRKHRAAVSKRVAVTDGETVGNEMYRRVTDVTPSEADQSQKQNQKQRQDPDPDARARGTPQKGFQPTKDKDPRQDPSNGAPVPVGTAKRPQPEPEYVPPPPAFLEALAKIGRMPE